MPPAWSSRRLEGLSEAIAAGVAERDQVTGVRALLLEMFEFFIFHPKPPANGEDIREAWLEPVIGAMGAAPGATLRSDLRDVLGDPSPEEAEGRIWARVLEPIAITEPR
jgi:hypothetical protein